MLAHARTNTQSGSVAYWDAALQYYLGIAEPEKLTDNEWANKIAYLELIRQSEA